MDKQTYQALLIRILGEELYIHLVKQTSFSVVQMAAIKKCFLENRNDDDAKLLRRYVIYLDSGEHLI